MRQAQRYSLLLDVLTHELTTILRSYRPERGFFPIGVHTGPSTTEFWRVLLNNKMLSGGRLCFFTSMLDS